MYFPRWGRAAVLGLLGAAFVESVPAQQPPAAPPVGAAGAAVASPADAPPVDSLIAWALRAAPRLQAQRHRAAAAQSRQGTAGAFANPTFEVHLDDVAFPVYTVGKDEMSTLGFEVRQDFGALTERGAARRLSHAAAAEQEIEVLWREREMVRDVRVAYARLYALDARVLELESARDVARQLREAATTRFGTGTGSMEPQLRTQIAVARIDAALDDARAERQMQWAALDALLGAPQPAGWGVFRTLPAVAVSGPDTVSTVAAGPVPVLRAQAGVATADQRVEVEIRGGRPRFELGAGYAYRGNFDPIVRLWLGTDLPVWRRSKQGPLVAAARLDAAAARAQLRVSELEAAAARQRWQAEWTRADAQLGRLRSTLVPQAEAALNAARAGYGAGRGDLATVLEDWEVWLRARQELSQREAERFAAWAELEALAPGPVPAPSTGERP